MSMGIDVGMKCNYSVIGIWSNEYEVCECSVKL
jgi:hypothetical protein